MAAALLVETGSDGAGEDCRIRVASTACA